MARPIKYTDEVKADIVDRINEYTKETEIPILKEFCYQHEIPHSSIYAHDEFIAPREQLLAKKEAQLERKALNNEINSTIAKLSLAQLGWSERQKIESIVSVDDRTFEWADEPANPHSRGS